MIWSSSGQNHLLTRKVLKWLLRILFPSIIVLPMKNPYVQRKCQTCRVIFQLCAACFRGQRTCSDRCLLERQRKLSRKRSRQYSSTSRGQEMNRLRQRRSREKRKTKHPDVTHATYPVLPPKLNPKPGAHADSEISLSCALCHRPVHINMQDSPHPATSFRRGRQKGNKFAYRRKSCRNIKPSSRGVESRHHCQTSTDPPRHREKLRWEKNRTKMPKWKP